MSLSPGARLGPYEVVAPIGAGGMGEVYRARDTRLERSVAIKVLAAHVASDPDRRTRFEREAKTISQLSHPNICALHDVGEQDGVAYLVMELLEGETLAQRLVKGTLPVELALRIAIEIADALARAHRQGIVHRDLKPANVMLTKSGAKLLDFGLAKAGAVTTSGFSQLSQMATGVAHPGADPLTAEGTLVGTFQYMSPEQLDGREADGRSDIWALGCVLYEMTTGRKAFAARSQASLISAILRDEPRPMREILEVAPAALEHVVRACLAKDPDERWQDAGDVARELSWIAQTGGSAGNPAAAARPARTPLWLAAAVFAVVSTLGAGALLLRARPEPRPLRSALLAPDGAGIDALASAPVLAPDGRRLALALLNAAGRSTLNVQDLETGVTQPIPGTSGAQWAFWSPDGRSLGFFMAGAVQRVALAGGAPERIFETNWGFGGAWGKNGDIVVATLLAGGLTHIRPDRSSALVTALDDSRGERAHYWPSFLPDGRHFVFMSIRTNPATQRAENEIWLQELGAKTRTRLVQSGSSAVYADPGYLLFLSQGDLVAQRFDAKRLRLVDDPMPVARGVSWLGDSGLGLLSAGGARVVYLRGGAIGLTQLAIVDRKGATLERLGSTGNFWTPRLSPDGGRVAAEWIDAGTRNRDIVVFATSGSSAPVRVTFDSGEDFTPVWSPDASRIAFATSRKGEWAVRVREMAGAGAESELAKLQNGSMLVDWSRDGRQLSVNQPKSADVDAITVDATTGAIAPLLATPLWERDATFSPNGLWIAYISFESGQPQVYVQGTGTRSGKWQISTAGGRQPRWRRDGKELFYVVSDSTLMALDVETGAAFRAAAARPLFTTPFRRTNIAQYDVFPDGQRFLANVLAGDDSVSAVSLIDNWTGALSR